MKNIKFAAVILLAAVLAGCGAQKRTGKPEEAKIKLAEVKEGAYTVNAEWFKHEADLQNYRRAIQEESKKLGDVQDKAMKMQAIRIELLTKYNGVAINGKTVLTRLRAGWKAELSTEIKGASEKVVTLDEELRGSSKFSSTNGKEWMVVLKLVKANADLLQYDILVYEAADYTVDGTYAAVRSYAQAKLDRVVPPAATK